jgi:mitochondrial ATPase complex subunit ATP10
MVVSKPLFWPTKYLACQWRSFSACTRLGTEKTASPPNTKPPPRSTEHAAQLADVPRAYGKRVDGKFEPKPLSRPIGMNFPPRAGENTGVDTRSLEQRRKDFLDYDKNLQRREEL